MSTDILKPKAQSISSRVSSFQIPYAQQKTYKIFTAIWWRGYWQVPNFWSWILIWSKNMCVQNSKSSSPSSNMLEPWTSTPLAFISASFASTFLRAIRFLSWIFFNLHSNHKLYPLVIWTMGNLRVCYLPVKFFTLKLIQLRNNILQSALNTRDDHCSTSSMRLEKYFSNNSSTSSLRKYRKRYLPCSIALTRRLVILMTSSRVTKDVWSEANSTNNFTAAW